MNKNDTLILIEADPNTDIFFNDWIKNGYKAEILFKKVNKPLRAIRRIFMINNFPFSYVWLNKWFNQLDKYKTVIIHMNRLTRYLPKLIVDKYPDIRVIGWYWNTITEVSKPIDFNNSNIEYWSFDENDCKKYNLHKNIQYYCPVEIDKNIKKENDIYFIGRDKGREKQIKEIKEIVENNNFKCNFKVISDNSNEIIPYSEVKKELLKTKSILELNKENQVGLTLRALESLFFEIKLITNNKSIEKFPFYNRNNVYIINEDNNLKEFINGKYDHCVDKYKEDYNLDKWFKNFSELSTK